RDLPDVPAGPLILHAAVEQHLEIALRHDVEAVALVAAGEELAAGRHLDRLEPRGKQLDRPERERREERDAPERLDTLLGHLRSSIDRREASPGQRDEDREE